MVNDQKKKGTNRKLLVAIAVAAVVIAGGGLVVISGTGNLLKGAESTGNGASQVTDLQAAQGAVTIPLSNITNTLSFYTYKSNGTVIKFFAVKGTDGNVHVAFDACNVCGPKGYTQSGNDVVCSNCGKHFAINDIGTANLKGGCWPSHLPMSVSGNSVTIKTSDLVTKESVFKT
ncbi:MAG: Fe-S-containing protein [Halobacteriota archaeon]